MKKILNFISWQWHRFELWQKAWFVAMFLFGAGVGSTPGSTKQTVLFCIAGTILGGLFLKGMIWDGIRNQWREYQEEQNKIVSIIKDGPK